MDKHDMLAVDGTSRLSPYLHLGCVSAVEVARRAEKAPEFVRQLAWRDFHHQVLAAWRAGETGIPIVDAGMRQLLAEGWMHNRARMIVASFMTKTLYLDWRAGAAHFYAHLLDGDVANNSLNRQWVAGTGTRPNPNGDYVRR